MSENILLALQYIYCNQKKAIKLGLFKGLRLKQCLDYVKMVEQFATAIDEKKITDLEEVLSYGE